MRIQEKISELDTLQDQILASLAAAKADPRITSGNPDYIRALDYAARIVVMEIGFAREAL